MPDSPGRCWQRMLLVTVFLVFAPSVAGAADDEKPGAPEGVSDVTAPGSLDELRAIEAKAVQTAKCVFPSVVGVNNSAGIIVSKEGLVLTAARLGGLRQGAVTVCVSRGQAVNSH